MRRLLIAEKLAHVTRWMAVAMPLVLLLGKTQPDVAFSLITGLFVIHSTLVRDFSWANIRWVQAGFAFSLYLGIRALLMTPFDAMILGYGLVWVRFPVGAAAFGYWLLRDATTRRYFFFSWTAVILFILADCLLQFGTGHDLFGHPIVLFEGALRLTGPYSNPRPGITALWLLFPLLLPWLGENQRWRGALLLIAAVTVIFISGERMALLLCAFGLGLSFLLLPRGRVPLVVASAIAALVAIGFAQQFPIIKSRQVDRIHHEVGGFWNSVYGRTWMSAAAIGNAHPLFGAGIKQFQRECANPAYGPSDPDSLHMRCPMHAHNLYLSTYAETGMVGLAFFLAVLAFLARDLWALRRHWWGQALATGLIITLILRVWPISVTPNAFAAWALIPLWMAVGWLFAILPRSPLDEPK